MRASAAAARAVLPVAKEFDLNEELPTLRACNASIKALFKNVTDSMAVLKKNDLRLMAFYADAKDINAYLIRHSLPESLFHKEWSHHKVWSHLWTDTKSTADYIIWALKTE